MFKACTTFAIRTQKNVPKAVCTINCLYIWEFFQFFEVVMFYIGNYKKTNKKTFLKKQKQTEKHIYWKTVCFMFRQKIMLVVTIQKINKFLKI